jgi:hypothetical protein
MLQAGVFVEVIGETTYFKEVSYLLNEGIESG